MIQKLIIEQIIYDELFFFIIPTSDALWYPTNETEAVNILHWIHYMSFKENPL